MYGGVFTAKNMVAVKWRQWIFLEFFSFTVCFAKYFTLVLPDTDKSSTEIPVGVLRAQTKLHCATLCDLVPSCYSFTYSMDSPTDNCRLLPSTAKSPTFTVSAAGNKHYERKVDCGACSSANYTMAMENIFSCHLQQETPHASGWVKSDMIPSGIVLNGNDEDHVATSSGCNTNPTYQCLQFRWYVIGPATLTVSGGSGITPSIYFTKSVADGVPINYELVTLDIALQDSSVIRFIGHKTRNSGGGSTSLGIFSIRMTNCPCSCVT